MGFEPSITLLTINHYTIEHDEKHPFASKTQTTQNESMKMAAQIRGQTIQVCYQKHRSDAYILIAKLKH